MPTDNIQCLFDLIKAVDKMNLDITAIIECLDGCRAVVLLRGRRPMIKQFVVSLYSRDDQTFSTLSTCRTVQEALGVLAGSVDLFCIPPNIGSEPSFIPQKPPMLEDRKRPRRMRKRRPSE